jgi:hypothetical protein
MARRGAWCGTMARGFAMAAASALLLALGACSGETPPPLDGGPDAGGGDAGRADAGPPDGGSDDAGPDAGTFEATELPYGLVGLEDAIDPAGEQDWYFVDATGGDWVSFTTNANPDGDADALDTVLGVYDASLTRLAENDDFVYPRDEGTWTTVDSQVLYRFPTTGRYYLRVEDRAAWAGETPRGGPTFTYRVSAYLLDPAEFGLVADAETGDDAASAVNTMFSPYTGHDPVFEIGYAIGTFRDADDVDVFGVSIGAGEVFVVQPEPHGDRGHGSTSRIGALWLTDAAGTMKLARVAPEEEPGVVSDPLVAAVSAGTYLLWVEHPGGATGTNDFYALAMFFRTPP